MEELLDENKEYKAFVEKFKPKKTTDDCYTPPNIYEAVVGWCEKEYSIDRTKIVRPFYPGGDYEHYPYKEDSVVIDNPPFSILSKIVRFYNENNIKYFLFAPTLTLFGSNTICTGIALGVSVIYENGARVNTSFTTNLNGDIRFRSCPELYRILNKVNKSNIKENTKTLPKYEYPNNVITPARLALFSKYGVDFSVKKNEAYRITRLESQKKYKKTIFGNGFLISDKKAQTQAQIKAQIEKKNSSIVFELSKEERDIIGKLGQPDKSE